MEPPTSSETPSNAAVNSESKGVRPDKPVAGDDEPKTMAASPVATAVSREKPRQLKIGRRRPSLLRRLGRRVRRRRGSRTEQTMLPVLIQVFAGFSKMDGKIDEAEIDSTLGFLRYDYPETVYSELRELYSQALRQPQNLNEIASDLAAQLPIEEKVLLGVQLYVLISRADLPKERLITFYQFMTTLGVASEAINIVYQLNTSELHTNIPEPEAEQPLETIIIARRKPADVVLQNISDAHSIAMFRFQDLILLKNIGGESVIVRGRQIREGEFCRVYQGQRVLISEVVLDYQDLVFYFNAKKDVSSTQLYLSLDSNGTHFVERARSKQSYLEIKFGLNIIVNVLHTTPGRIGGAPLQRGVSREVSLLDKIVFDDKSEIAVIDLRQRAKELGGRFELAPSKSEYLVSNDPTRLRQGDILVSTGASGELLLRIICDYQEKCGTLEVLTADRPIAVENTPVRGTCHLRDGDTISVGNGQYLRCHFSDRIIEEERNLISTLSVRDLTHSYDRKDTAIDNVSLSVQRGEMICVMGPSGCGKSTLLKALAGQLKPAEGKVLLNGADLYQHHKDLTPYISFIPHQEAIDPLLTVEENIDTAAAIRAPHFTRAERRRRADAKLVELGLNEIRHRVAGDANAKNLSGGQRKRLNAGLDMIGISDVYFFDEPTSGLSSKDSEHVLEIIRGLTHNKITFVSIHQPSSRLFHMFHKAILLDNGGKLAFFGSPAQTLEYFAEAAAQEGVSHAGLPNVPAATPSSGEKPCAPAVLTPDFVFDILETPLRDLGGDVIYEQDSRGQLIPARRFSPGFWRDRFQTYRLLQEVNLRDIEPDSSNASKPQQVPKRPSRTKHDEWIHFANQFKRSFLSKLRNRSNLATTLLEAPALAILVASVLRYSEEGHYNFASAFHIPTYLFLTLVIGLFLGLTNSAEEIIRDRTLLERERNQGIKVGTYLLSKLLSLGVFAFFQCVIYLLIGDYILGIRDMFWHNLFWMFMTAFVGVASGLLISSIVSSSKTALNIIPLILIPNIILGGALIKYEEMNRGFDILGNLSQWLGPDRAEGEQKPSSNLKVPTICEFMPLRWSYESVIIAHAERNPASALINDIYAELDYFVGLASDDPAGKLTPEQEQRLDAAKEALTVVHGLEAKHPNEVHRAIKNIRADLKNGTFDRKKYSVPVEGDVVTAEQLYLNSKVIDLFNRAEIERNDYRQSIPPNVFFGATKRIGLPKRFFPTQPETGEARQSDRKKENQPMTFSIDTLLLNGIALAMFSVLAIAALHINLARQLRRV